MKRLSVLAAVVVLVLMIHAWGGSATDASGVVSCWPDCSNASDGDRVVNPRDCTQYFHCVGGTPAHHPINCPAGDYFDGSKCVPGACEDICYSIPTGGDCILTCNYTLSAVSFAFNCSAYFYCTPSQPMLYYCPSDRPYFDATTHSCVNDESVCCGGYCQPYCDGSGFAFVPDPKDCTKFYVCDNEEGIPGEDYHFSCYNGYFDINIGDCVSGTPPDPCPTLCELAGGGDTSPSHGVGDTTTIINYCPLMECTAEGYFPCFTTCQPLYFECSSLSLGPVLYTCPNDMVFNPTPEYPFCVLPSDCPYP